MTVKGQLTHELEVGMPARVMWEEAYGTLQLSKLIVKLLPNIVQDIKVEGDGGWHGPWYLSPSTPVKLVTWWLLKNILEHVEYENAIT